MKRIYGYALCAQIQSMLMISCLTGGAEIFDTVRQAPLSYVLNHSLLIKKICELSCLVAPFIDAIGNQA